LFGQFTPNFILLDKEWFDDEITSLWSESYPHHLRIQVWNGFLSSPPHVWYVDNETIYKSYLAHLRIDIAKENDREYHIDFDEAIANHLLYYFVNRPKWFLESELFNTLLHDGSPRANGRFKELLGRHMVSEINPVNLKEVNEHLGRSLSDLWEVYLEKCSSTEVLREFGYWLGNKAKFFRTAALLELIIRTLRITSGLHSYRYALEDNLMRFTKLYPEKVIQIAELVILEGMVRTIDEVFHHHYISDQ
jgi:hypothetical protein